MTEQRELQGFAARLNAEVRERAGGLGSDDAPNFRENVFAELILEYLAEIGTIEDGLVAYFEGQVGRGTARVNGYSINDEEDTVDLIVSIFFDTPEPVTVGKDEVVRAMERAERFLDGALNGIYKAMETTSDAYAMASRIFELGKGIRRARVFIITDGMSTTRTLEETKLRGIRIQREIWDITRLFRGMQAGLPRDEIDIDFERDFGGPLPCLQMPKPAREFIAYLAILPGTVLYTIYEEYGSRLLELNVRAFLSARGKINAGIRHSLQNEPDRFVAYNNGIVATVDALKTTTLPDGRLGICRVQGFQIVNGGQTTASIHRARKIDRVDLSSVFVPAKITLIDPPSREEIVARVSRYANTQNVIQMADFSANEPFHVELERLSQRIWCPGEQYRWFYERARGQYQVAKARLGITPAQARRFNEQTPPSRKFTKTDVARYEQTWLLRPHLVSLGAQKNFDKFMQDLRTRFGKEWLPDDNYYRELIAKAIIYRAVDRVVKLERFPAYRPNIGAYLAAYLCYRAGGRLDLQAVWQKQEVSDELKEMLRSWSHSINSAILESARGRNITEWCKKEQCWDHVRSLSLELPEILPAEMQSATDGYGADRGTPAETVSYEDLQNVQRCREIDATTWLSIHAWGTQSGLLERWQAGIAHTLAGYAANRWSRAPSPKQARQAVKILNLAAEHGALEKSTAPETPGK